MEHARSELEQHYTIQEVAAALRISSRTVRQLVQRGQLRAIRIRRRLRIPASAIGEAFPQAAGSTGKGRGGRAPRSARPKGKRR